MSEIHKICISSFFVILGIILPLITHSFMAGPVYLLMHIPVLLAGMILGIKYGALVAVLTPLISYLITGMPVIYPMLPIMIFELLGYGVISGLLVERFHLQVHFTLVISQVGGRIMYGIVYGLLLFTRNDLDFSMSTAILSGLPGIVIQLVMIPLIMVVLKERVLTKYIYLRKVFKEAIKMVNEQNYSLVIVRKNKIIETSTGKGIKPILEAYENNLLKNSYVFDKVVGRGCALIGKLGEVRGIYGLISSKDAIEYLESINVKYGFKTITENIMNRTNTDICPIEKCVIGVNDPIKAYQNIKERLTEMSN